MRAERKKDQFQNARPPDAARDYGLWILLGLMVAAVAAAAWWGVPDMGARAYPDPVTLPAATSAPDRAAPEQTEQSLSVCLNTATAEELTALPGLGLVTAEKIIAYRERYGPFLVVEDLLYIDGVGEKKLAQWRPYLTV